LVFFFNNRVFILFSNNKAVVGIAFALGFTFGPSLGALMTSYDIALKLPDSISEGWGLNPYSNPALLSLGLILVEFVFLCFSLDESLAQKNTKNATEQDTDAKDATSGSTSKDEKDAETTFKRKKFTLRVLSFLHFIYLFTFSGMEFTLTFLTYDRFDFSNLQQGKMLGYIGILSALIQGGYVRRKARKVGEKKLVEQGVACCALALWVLSSKAFPTSGEVTSLDPGLIWLYVAATLLAFTSATVVNCLTSLASMLCDDEDDTTRLNKFRLPKGRMLGGFRSFGQLGRAIGPLFACSLYWYLGSTSCYLIGSGSTLLIYVLIRWTVPQVSHDHVKKSM
jgi:hypothetical protein